jgi:hypothetical protein
LEIGLAEVGPFEDNRLEQRPDQFGLPEIRLIKKGLAEVSSPQVGSTEVGLSEARLAELGLIENGLLEIGLIENGPDEHGSGEIGPAEIDPFEQGSMEIGLTEVGPTQVWPYIKACLPPLVPHVHALLEQNQLFRARPARIRTRRSISRS